MSTPDPILTALARLEERIVQRLGERMDEWQRMAQLDLDGRFDAIDKRLDRLEQEYEMLRVGMSRLEADVGTLKADVGTLKTEVTSLSSAVQRMEREIASLRLSIESLEARLRQDASDRHDLGDQLQEGRRRLDDLEERVRIIEARLPED